MKNLEKPSVFKLSAKTPNPVKKQIMPTFILSYQIFFFLSLCQRNPLHLYWFEKKELWTGRSMENLSCQQRHVTSI